MHTKRESSCSICSICIRDENIIFKPREAENFKNEKYLIINLCLTGILTTSSFQCLHRLFWYQEIGSFKFSLSLKMMTSSNSTSVSVDSNFNTIVEISIMNYLYIPNLCYIPYSIAKILEIHVFIVLKMVTSSNAVDCDN